MLNLRGEVREVALVGAHCDDLAIGAGGTLLTLAEAAPGLRVRALVLCGGDSERGLEERAALQSFCPGADLELTVLTMPDGRTPAYWALVKSAVHELRRGCSPDVVFAPQPGDAHQDHRLLAELVPTEFRDHLVLGYEILKWETDTPRPTLFHPLPEAIALRKAELLLKHYPSQRDRDWFDEQSFLGLARVRGVQCRARYAEAFVIDKAAVVFGGM
ncbi:PIG-L family deacetylase [Nocardia sp. CDC159]|uniref:PIG-L family deacetylase n=1 Tax=Nocardia pulmonis TaxID=2951408 RepID=A0A9X2E3K3_9NOCA|nr:MULTISPECIES: PIG-L family deacetylase [Nocardia]MCM6772185.1 PIG-L family deacetylase [Nocardia pulmonis]MCM6785157.1 PIG-L family deacetylase [Nocardia sp. CDC159]